MNAYFIVENKFIKIIYSWMSLMTWLTFKNKSRSIFHEMNHSDIDLP